MASPPSPLGPDDYDAIAQAVMETARGRWFLAEYARRNRQADTTTLMEAIERLERAVRTDTATAMERVHDGLVEMSDAIAKAKAEIALLKPEGRPSRLEEATGELDLTIEVTEAAASDILASAERIQEIAWTMRERGVDTAFCGALDAQASELYTACSFQDLTGQRTRRVIQVLRYLESRIAALVELWDAPSPAPPGADKADEHTIVLSGPARPGEGLAQADVDSVMAPLAPEPADPTPTETLARVAALNENERLAAFS